MSSFCNRGRKHDDSPCRFPTDLLLSVVDMHVCIDDCRGLVRERARLPPVLKALQPATERAIVTVRVNVMAEVWRNYVTYIPYKHLLGSNAPKSKHEQYRSQPD